MEDAQLSTALSPITSDITKPPSVMRQDGIIIVSDIHRSARLMEDKVQDSRYSPTPNQPVEWASN